MSLVITGASGQLGRRTAEILLDQVDPADVVLVSRSAEKLADLTARGADVRNGDFDDPASLPAAFAGGTRMLLISGTELGVRVRQHQNAIDAAVAAGVGHIAYTSIPNPVADNPAAVVPDHHATEQALAASGVAFTYLRNALYSDMRLDDARAALADGVLRTNTGAGRTAFVAREDCAASAAAVLRGGAEHDGRAYDITGPQLLGADELAEIYGRIGGAEVTVARLDDDAYIAGLEAAGLPAEVAQLLASFGTAIREGRLDQLTGDVESLTGRAPVTVESVVSAGLAAATAA